MTTKSRTTSAAACVSTLLAALAAAQAGNAAPTGNVDLSPTPPSISAAVDPNVVLTIDESGSMAQAFVPGSIGEGDSQFGNNAGFILSPYSGVKTCGWLGVETGPATIHGWNFSAAVNTLYSDPGVTYSPPNIWDGTQMPDASFTAAWEDGIAAHTGGSTATRNLQSNYVVTWSGGNSPKPNYIYPATAANPQSTACGPGNTGYMNFPFAGNH